MVDIASLRRKSAVDVDKLVEAAKDTGSEKRRDDNRFWKPTVDKAGNGYAVIRFLPSPDEEGLPWAKFWDHAFVGPTGQWFIEKSLTSLNQDCPVSEMNQKLWNSGNDMDKKFVQGMGKKKPGSKRRLHYIANILVITDSGNPDNEGKVFLYDFGAKIFDKVMGAMQPQYPDEKPMNPFDLWEGGNFAIKIRQVEGYRNYDNSEFKSPSELFDGDEEQLQGVANQLASLKEFIDPENYKTREQLEKRLRIVMGWDSNTATTQPAPQKQAPAPEPKSAPEPEVAAQAEEPELAAADAEADDAMSYFAQFAEDE